jgi:hypothetical protein
MDQTDGDYGLTMNEIKSAVSAAGGVDLMLFTAPCLMGALESVYQVRDWVDVYIGSEDLSGYIGWFRTIGFIRTTLETNPEIGNPVLGQNIVSSIAANIPLNEQAYGSYGAIYTMSAVDVKAVSALAADLDALVGAFVSDQASIGPIKDFADRIQNYNNFYSIDLGDFLEKYKATQSSPDVLALVSRVQESLTRSILAEYHGSGNPGSHGLTIYFPIPSYISFDPTYSDPQYGLDFATDTKWDEFLKFYKNERL